MNPYDVLGVQPDASDEEISRAYKRLAKKYHPDLNPNDAAAAEKMGRLNRAYDDIKAMRQDGAPFNSPGHESAGGYYSAYQNPFDPFSTQRTYYYTRPRHSLIGMILAVVVMIFLVRLILSILFGGYVGQYYYGPAPEGGNMPGYGYYQTMP